MSVINYPHGEPVDIDNDENPSPERLRIRNRILESVAHIGEDAAAKHYRERTVAIEVRRRAEPEVKARATEDWDRRFDERFDHRLVEHVDNEDGVVAQAAGFALFQSKKEMREHVERVVREAVAATELKFKGQIADLEKRLRNASARLPQVKTTWTEGDVALEGELYSHQGSLWQARRATGQAPGGGPHWVMIARGAHTVASPAPNLPAPNFGAETSALRAELRAGV
jgi:hypothetical protein